MTVSVIDGQLKVVLTETETVRFNIDRVFFDKISESAEKALSCLLKLAAAKVGFDSESTCFLIELYPVFEGGCEVWFIPKPDCRTPKKAKTAVKKTAVFEFQASDSMLSACEALYLDPKTRYCRSMLFEYRGRYRLISFGLSQAVCRKISCNFADRYLTSSVEKAKTLEYGKCICRQNAVAVVGAAICRK